MTGRPRIRRLPRLVVAAPALALAGLLACVDGGDAPPPVFISELMYHPVEEQSPQEHHEFVELHNRSEAVVALGGWRLADGIRFTFPAGATLGPRGHLVVAKNRGQLLVLTSYGLDGAAVLGDYDGELDNDGERVVLLDAKGVIVDDVTYDDRFPWPVGADGLGAGERWLSPEKLGGAPLAAHRFFGRSLERVAFGPTGASASNWEASPLDGPTPGRPPVAGETARTTVATLQAGQPGGTGARIAASEPVRIAVGFFADAGPQAPAIEYFVDDFERSDEPTTRVALLQTRTSEGFEAMLPLQKERSVVRYRVLDTRDGRTSVVSPRPSDPDDWHAYFVAPPGGNTPAFHLFISTANWERMWDHMERGRVPGHVGVQGGVPGFCTPNPYWNARVPATLAVDGQVYEIQVRYQGSTVSRAGGRNIDRRAWPMDVAAPARPAAFRVLSWRVHFPRHNRYEKKAAFNLNKLIDGACGFSYAVGTTLFERAGLPAGEPAHYVRLFINGGYYGYMQRMERIDEDLIERFFGKDHPMGDLFKSTGGRWDQGPFGWGDARILEDHCGYGAAERYAATYERESLTDWKRGSPEVQQLIEDLHAARAQGVPAMRAFFEKNFDVPILTTYMAIRNWLGPWDDYFHNYYLYRRTDGRWLFLPNDFDGEMGNNPLSWHDTSFFNGRENDRSNRNNWSNYLKDAYLQSFRDELVGRLEELSRTVLHPSHVTSVIDEVAARYDVAEARQAASVSLSPMIPLCGNGDPPMVVERMKTFARLRHERILDKLFD